MEYLRLSIDWNADPNAPEVEIFVSEDTVKLIFFLNYFQFENFIEGDKAVITFYNCHKYSFNNMNDEGYYNGKYRYSNHELPWGEFYQIHTDWREDFPRESIILKPLPTIQNQQHYIFFFRDNTFECVAESYSIKFKTVIRA
jgi:hypothetical protein